jgi:hypothetical protein
MRAGMQLKPHPSQFLSLRETGRRVNGSLAERPIKPIAGRHSSLSRFPPVAGPDSDSGVPAKAQVGWKFIEGRIDAGTHRRYSQAQIPDLVANAIPRFRTPAQSFGSTSPCAFQSPETPNFDLLIAGHPARLNPTLFNRFGLSADTRQADDLCIDTPYAVPLSRKRIPSTIQRRTGGQRIL